MISSPCVFSESDDVSMPDTLGHSVGPERWELLTRLAGNEVWFLFVSVELVAPLL